MCKTRIGKSKIYKKKREIIIKNKYNIYIYILRYKRGVIIQTRKIKKSVLLNPNLFKNFIKQLWVFVKKK